MRLPQFEYLHPDNLDQALALLDQHQMDVRVLAGGTDLLVRMKKRLLAPKYVLSLKSLDELSFIEETSEGIDIGARTPLADIITSTAVQTHAPALIQACRKVGAVTLQHYTGTIGGNILQDNRCHHYNQSDFYRSGRQACHKDGGKICYAREESDRCNSTCQSDGATALMALDAVLTLQTSTGSRTVNLAHFYTTDGIMPFAMEPRELLTKITIPKLGGSSAYEKLAYRAAIDYPLVCAGVQVFMDPGQKDKIADARIVVGAMGRAPLVLTSAATKLKGKSVTDLDAFKQAAKDAMDSAATFAVHNVGSTLEYRCAMTSHMVFRALKQAVENNI